jgi:plasmid replication initiation protein
MELAKIEDNKNNIVVKHQELVHNARYRLSELGIKVLSVLISMVRTSDTEFTQYAIQIKDFKELIHSDSKNTYKYAHKLISELMSNPMQIGDEQFNWASYGKYHRGDGVVVFEIHRLLKPYLLELQQNFLQYNITNILPLKSGYVIRLYELCKDHFNEATRYKESVASTTFDIKLDRLRELFEIPKSYAYKDIRVNVLDKAVEQFKNKTDIQIDYKVQKIGRRVDRVLITVRENNRGSNDYMKSKQAFIRYMRANFINADVLVANDTKTNKQVMISIAPDGKLYDKRGSEFDAKRSNEIWDSLFKLSQEDKLLCLKQGTLF